MSETKEQKPEEPEVKKPEAKKERWAIRDVTPEGAAKNTQMKLTRTFIMDFELDDGEKVSGMFTVKRVTIGDLAMIGVRRAQLLAELQVDYATTTLAEAIAWCEVAYTSVPDWFKPTEMYDFGPTERAWSEARAFQQSFRKRNVEQRPATPEGDSSSKAEG